MRTPHLLTGMFHVYLRSAWDRRWRYGLGDNIGQKWCSQNSQFFHCSLLCSRCWPFSSGWFPFQLAEYNSLSLLRIRFGSGWSSFAYLFRKSFSCHLSHDFMVLVIGKPLWSSFKLLMPKYKVSSLTISCVQEKKRNNMLFLYFLVILYVGTLCIAQRILCFKLCPSFLLPWAPKQISSKTLHWL